MIYHKTLLADTLTPISAFMQISEGAQRSFLLESVEGGEQVSRYSFMGANPESSYEGTLRLLRETFPSNCPTNPDLPPFTGGAVGFFSYEMIREFEDIKDLGKAYDDIHPRQPVSLDYYSTILAFDHVKHQIVIMSHESQKRVDELAQKLREQNVAISTLEFGDYTEHDIKTNVEKAEFEESVVKAKQYIEQGDIFQVVLSQRLEVDYDGDQFNVYRALRHINPSPYLYYIKQNETTVVGASPEPLVKLVGRDLQYRPIAGTRPRSNDPVEEKRLEEDLLSDEKERAEHLMLVDLGRNDLGRICEFGSVKVDQFMSIEKFSHVMHIVSKLKGKIRAELNCFDALEACFPAGTVSGAPKIRAMEIIEELETCRRGIYSGAIGYLDFSGNLDTCIAIRTIVIKNNKAYIQAGAGIVADSIPENEYQECLNKAKGMVKSIEMAKGILG
jgi:anthranilate synthase component 1